MNTQIRLRITAGLAGALAAAGILAGAGHLPSPQQLADYGSNDTAEIAGQDARDAGVPHQHDARHSAGYFERMDGGSGQ